VPDLEWGELKRAVQNFGLNEREAEIYLRLQRLGPASAQQVARDAGLDRVVTYRTLDLLRARGVVQATAERPRRYVPIPPADLFRREIESRREALARDESYAEDLLRRYPILRQTVAGAAPRFETLKGSKVVYPHLKEMVRRARESLWILITQKAFRESVRFGIHRELPRLLQQKAQVRMILEGRGPNPSYIVEMARRFQERFPEFEFRVLEPQPARVTLVDHREAAVFAVPEGGQAGEEEIAIWTDARDFVRSQEVFFESLWSRSVVPPSPKVHRARNPS
jgi:sugar-specific transcriptional regulator TrmB